MALKNLLRLGSDYTDIDGKDSSHFWIHPEGKIYIRKSYSNAVCGWKLSNNKIIDYWGKEWFEIIPVSKKEIDERIFN